MTDVFLSYSREDEKEAARFAEMLESAGLTVWWDRKIPPGKTWDQVIGKALNEAKCVVVLWTKTSVASDWVKEEAARGAQRGALVPVLLDEVEAPLGFGRIEAAELANWEGDPGNPELQNFLAAVQERVGRPVEAVSPQPTRLRLQRSRRALMVGGAAILLALVGFVAWEWLGSTQEPAMNLDMQIWEVEGDRKRAVAAAKSFTAGDRESGSASDFLAAQVVGWITKETVRDTEPAQVHLVIPEDPTTDSIRLQSTPEIELETYLYISGQSSKSRVPSQLRPEDLVFVGDEFAIEIAATGYDSIPVKVVIGGAQERTFELKPLPVKLAVEELAGPQNRFAAKLTELLSANPRVQVFGPEALDELRREIERNREAIGVNRAAQVAIRDSLGVDYIVGGRLGGE